MKQKKRTKAIAIVLSLAMVFSFVPFLGTQEAYAMPVKDNVVIDLTNGPVVLEGAEEQAVDYTTFMMGGKQVIGIESTHVGEGLYEEKLDLDKDGTYDIFKNVDTNNNRMTIELLDTCSVYGTKTVNATDSWIAEMKSRPDGYNGWEYMYASVTFKISNKEVRDSYDMLFTENTYTITDAEALAVQVLLNDLGENEVIDITSAWYQYDVGHITYDLDKNGSDDIYTEVNSGATNLFVKKLETCSVNEPKTFTLPDAVIAYQVLNYDDVEYVYKSLSLVMILPPGPPVMYIGGATVELSQTSFTYNGKVQKPAIVKIGGSELVEGEDYIAEWSNEASVNSGTYTVTIKGTGNYRGTTKATYKINKAANTLKAYGKTVKVKKKAVKKKNQTLAVGKVLNITNRGQGKLTYAKLSGNKKITINAANGTVTVKKKLKKGTYTVAVRITAAGNANYNAVARVVKFTVKVK